MSNRDLAWNFTKSVVKTIEELKRQGKDQDIDMHVYVHARAFHRLVKRQMRKWRSQL